MKSVRLDPLLEARLRQAADLTGQPESAIIRQAIQDHCDAILTRQADKRLADVIGIVSSGEVSDASEVREEFARILEDKAARRWK